jgi:hypothetical protein
MSMFAQHRASGNFYRVSFATAGSIVGSSSLCVVVGFGVDETLAKETTPLKKHWSPGSGVDGFYASNEERTADGS